MTIRSHDCPVPASFEAQNQHVPQERIIGWPHTQKKRTSLAASNDISQTVEAALRDVEDVERFARRTGRAELDEHAEGVNMTEFLVEFDPDSPRFFMP